MSCEYCDAGRDMNKVVGGIGHEVERIRIDRVLCFRRATYVGDKFHIGVDLPGGYAMTLPINYCPMCGERLSCGKDEL